MPIVISTLACLRGTSAMRCCDRFFMGTVCSSFGGPAHPIYRSSDECDRASTLKCVETFPYRDPFLKGGQMMKSNTLIASTLLVLIPLITSCNGEKGSIPEGTPQST